MSSLEPGRGARRVVTGLDSSGRSIVTSDGPTPAQSSTPAYSNNQMWLLDLPTTVLAEDASGGQPIDAFPQAGLVYFITTFPPGSESGMHQTDTFDILTVVSGELVCALEEGEVVLAAGDSIVQRGTLHEWINRSEAPATVVTLMVGASR